MCSLIKDVHKFTNAVCGNRFCNLRIIPVIEMPENNNVSSSNNLTFEDKSFGKLLI